MTLGCAKPETYEQQLQDKVQLTQSEFQSLYSGDIDVYASEPTHFRMRAEFKIWHKDSIAHYAMYQPGEYKKPVIISEFTIGSETICNLMPKLLQEINTSDTLRRKLFQVEFLTTQTKQSVITLIYHKSLDEIWEQEAQVLSQALNTQVIGRSRKQKVVLNTDFVIEEMQINQTTFQYQQVETGFTQPNAKVCEKMLSWAYEASAGLGGDLVELYCGNGNFTLPLSQNFERVLATEVSKTSVNSALYNIKANNIENIQIARMSSEEFTQALNGEREFRRLKDIDLPSYSFSTIFVDPPRAGLDTETEKLCSRFDNIIYISCNPETLKNNLSSLTQTHTIEKMALFDQFPYTTHRECGVILKKKQ
ncbi:tRNA (uridine(54)-C5)-methyltransferase TrmA [Teredinibacter sp. KSP-S5-2]|uniref:tRNA (uridine(54)-C5)-methyltransferase TrmA n=1 Tax=Teredinibacter sp. KSP-S5-2 TaxID=3034506 RepID=UPI002934E907|nr:tRNA (uridine(54)-C5)-methyltransferase TrmA [Teredinibacter sp. KSP-S5-2]WNO10917.1 tRNA (uridine(54)-C5)-methyltransferase TrmA [Teredinibacter sp. KSP-S5-2]